MTYLENNFAANCRGNNSLFLSPVRCVFFCQTRHHWYKLFGNVKRFGQIDDQDSLPPLCASLRDFSSYAQTSNFEVAGVSR